MSDSGTGQDESVKRIQKRNLPSWMSSREAKNKSHGKTTKDEKSECGDKQPPKGCTKKSTGNGSSEEPKGGNESSASSSSFTDFSKLMDGVVFVLSGFVNPERSTLRSQALAMGASYQADWNSECTLLVCAFPNTPKFRQVQADCGTIVSKEWISECYAQKKLFDIEQYLMHAGKPWRKSKTSHKIILDKKGYPPRKPQKHVDTRSESKPAASLSSKSKASSAPAKEWFSPSEVKKWVTEDLTRTISWLESQEEKPERGEIKPIAAEGILTCLQDAIDSLEQNQDGGLITEQWNFIPRVVEELINMETCENESASFSKDQLCKQAKAWKRIYEEELKKPENNKKPKNEDKGKSGKTGASFRDASGCDSDDTIEMAEEEIQLAYENVASKYC